LAAICDTYAGSGILIDPHTAVGVAAARAEIAKEDGSEPMIALACAHPAKFPDAVERATGMRPPVPAILGNLLERRERITVLPKDFGTLSRFVRERARRRERAA